MVLTIKKCVILSFFWFNIQQVALRILFFRFMMFLLLGKFLMCVNFDINARISIIILIILSIFFIMFILFFIIIAIIIVVTFVVGSWFLRVQAYLALYLLGWVWEVIANMIPCCVFLINNVFKFITQSLLISHLLVAFFSCLC